MTYSYDEALSASTDYFNGEELPARVFVDKYALRNIDNELIEKTPDDMHRRLAKEFARIEAKKFKEPYSEEYIYSLFKKYATIIPQGSPIYGVGNKEQYVSVSNCIVVDSPEDSYGGILKTDQELVQLSKRRCGVGLDLSKLRPSKSRTQNSSRTSTGTRSWMNRYSNSIREVGQDGRRGALMLTLSVHHPDILEFISAKEKDTDVTGANISVRLTDEFLNAVENDSEYEQRWPINAKTPKISHKINARGIWEKLIHHAWSRAEPGLLFWDNILRDSLPDCYEGYQTQATNPCIVGDTIIAVADGRNGVSIRQLANEGKDVPVYSTDIKTGQRQIKMGRNPRKTKSNVEVWKLTLDDDSILIATPDHKVLKRDMSYCELRNLKYGDSINPFNTFISNKRYRQVTNTGKKMKGGIHRNRRQYRLIHEYYSNSIVDAKKYAIHHIDFNSFNDKYENLDILDHKLHNELHSSKMKGLNNPYYKKDKEWRFKFASHPGDSNPKWIDVSNKELLEHGKRLFNQYGFISKKLWINYAKQNKLPQSLNNAARFGSFSNFKNQVSSNHKVKSVEFIGYQDVYNITVDDNNNYDIITSYEDTNYNVSSGITIKNCGEIPLSANDSCRLLVIMLMKFVKNPFTKNAYFDFKAFYEVAQVAQRLMDDLVDLELECIDRILAKLESDPESEEIKRVEIDLQKKLRETCYNGRRTGLGCTALGDTVAACGLKYGSDESIEFVERIYKTLKFGSYRSSVDMAKELNPFPVWDWQKEKDNPFLTRLIDEDIELGTTTVDGVRTTGYIYGEDLYDDIRKYGRRNIANLTSSPAGTISTQAGYQVGEVWYFGSTSGIEPLFDDQPFSRRKKIIPGDKDARTDFVDKNGDNWMEFDVYHPGIKAWKDNNDVGASPYHGATANTIVWTQRVKLQAAAQRHIDHSISSTVNLPEDIKEEEVAKIYTEAWKSGCKGITVYRDKCRSGVLIHKQEKEVIKDRPKELPCDVHHITVKGKQYFVLVGLLNGKPYEVFAGKNGFIDKDVKHGNIIKQKKGLYKVIFEDETDLSPITASSDEHEETITRLTSALLRTGADIIIVVQQLEKVNGEMLGFSKALARALKLYIKNNTKEGEKCPSCEADLVRQDGCPTCKNCGFSRCS